MDERLLESIICREPAVEKRFVWRMGLLHRVLFIGGANCIAGVGNYGRGDGEFDRPSTLAIVPGLGLVVREFSNGGRLQCFATADAVAMAAMSVSKTTWMMAVARSARMIRA